jgi:subtilase family serine protease
LVALAVTCFAHAPVDAQTVNRIARDADLAALQTLPNHHPQWANPVNDEGLAPPDRKLDNLTLILSRSPEQEKAFEKFLADQLDPASPEYHHWLTPAEVGERFGPSNSDLTAIEDWLQSQGLHVNFVAPSRMFVGFGGEAARIGLAFRTELHHYKVNNMERMSVSSDPVIPKALAPAIKAIQGLYSTHDRPFLGAKSMRSDSPAINSTTGEHFIVPADFATIYDLSGTGMQTIGIVGRSRTNLADITNFELKTLTEFPNPTEIVPTAFGGVDPGPAFTTPPPGGVSLEDQLEATLDVTRAASIAQDGNVLLVVATEASGGIEADAQYLVQTSPVPAQIVSISFGECESSAGPSKVTFWDTLFQQAAAEGISVFVASGDSGASGCDEYFAVPPANPQPNSPNYICSSSYATCVGGTEFNDTANPSLYWNASNRLYSNASALSYIPEGAWNDPLDANLQTQAAASGGGVSAIIPTPSWQTGTGVPAERTGRYTPDIAFSASAHDGYFGCFAAGGNDCVSDATGTFYFEYFYGTSAAAPSMAGIAARLNTRLGLAQGNLNPEIYQMAVTAPNAFHDVTVETSGVTNCDIDTPSMCNNSIPGPGGPGGGQAGYMVTAGYDLVTGLGSLDVTNFLENYIGPKTTPAIIGMLGPFTITTAQGLGLSLTVEGREGVVPTGTLTLTSGNYTSGAITLNNGSIYPSIRAQSLSIGNNTVTVTYTPDVAGTQIYNSASTTISITVTYVPMITPTVTVTPPSSSTNLDQPMSVLVSVSGGSGNQAPTGTVVLTSGSYTSAALALQVGFVGITIPALTLAVGNDTLTVNYTPDSVSSTIYYSATGSSTTTVTLPPPSFTVAGTAISVQPGATTGNASTVTVTPLWGFTGSVALTAVIVSSPAGAQYPPTLSFGATSPVSITGADAKTATLTISTTAATSAEMIHPRRPVTPWYALGGASLACILFFGIPMRRRNRWSLPGMLALLVILASGILSCGGGGSTGGGGGGGGGGGNPGTTAGFYTITVTGTSGTITASSTVALTVQ